MIVTGAMDIILSDFEQGGFYVDGGTLYSSTTEVRSDIIPIPIPEGVIRSVTVLTAGDMWSFIGYNSSSTFVLVSESYGYKASGDIIDISAYPTVKKMRIELHNENGISPPQTATLRVVYEYEPTWQMDDDYPVPINAPELPENYMVKPYPAAYWRIEEGEEYPSNGLMPEIPANGAFANASELTQISIPQSVKYIGEEAFKYTKLKSVTIASDCTYFDTSFPEGCEIKFY
jgi:hypothetical protein